MAQSDQQPGAGVTDVQFEPSPSRWGELLANTRRDDAKTQAFLGRSAGEWRELTRRELGVPMDRPVIATGHEAVLWHPGILAKYIALRAWAQHCGAACVHLVVDQHVGGFDSIDVPVRSEAGELTVAKVSLGAVKPDVPMGWHPPLDPPEMRASLQPALPSVECGLQRIFELVRSHRHEPSAAAQFSGVLDELLKPWFASIPGVTASALMITSLARAMVQAMLDDPRGAVEHYNNAVAQVPEAGIGGLSISENEIELPLWRIGADGRRQRAFDHDARQWLDNPNAFALLPRALTMTALLRLGVSDVFIHGFGGARYDPAMELWMASWLRAIPQPFAQVSATLRLPFASAGDEKLDPRIAGQHARHVWHDPAGAQDQSPSDIKQAFLERIEQTPHNSTERRTRFLEMHDALDRLRDERRDVVDAARKRLELARRQERERHIVERRNWPFPFYPDDMIDELARTVTSRVKAGCGEPAQAVTSARSRAR